MHYPCDTAQRPSSIAGSCSSAHKLPPSPSMAAAAGFRWKCLYSGPLLYTDDRPILHCCWKGMWFIAVPSDITNMLLYKGEIILNSPSLLPALVHHMLKDTAFWVNNEIQHNKVKAVMIKLNICSGIFLLNEDLQLLVVVLPRQKYFFPGHIPDKL